MQELGGRFPRGERQKLVTVGPVLRREMMEAKVFQRLHGEAGLLGATAQHILLEEMHHRRESPLPIRWRHGARIENARPPFAAARALLVLRSQLAVETQAGRHHGHVQRAAGLEPAQDAAEGTLDRRSIEECSTSAASTPLKLSSPR